MAPKPVVVRDTKPTVTATIASDAGTVDAGTVTFSSGGTVLGTAPVSGGTASLQLPAYDSVGSRTVTVAYSGVAGRSRPRPAASPSTWSRRRRR